MSRWWTSPVKLLLGILGFESVRFGSKLVVHPKSLTVANTNSLAARRHLAAMLAGRNAGSDHVDLVVDVGANRGQFGEQLRSLGYRGRILSLEPLEHLATELARRVSSDRLWKVRRVAVGREDGTVRLHRRSHDDFSSIGQPTAEGIRRFGRELVEVAEEEVEMLSLTSLAASEPWVAGAQRIFLKLDTQGYDMNILEGLGTLRGRIVSLQTEVAAIPLYEGVLPLHGSLARLDAMGFGLTGFFPITVDATSGEVVEADVRFVRRASPSETDCSPHHPSEQR